MDRYMKKLTCMSSSLSCYFFLEKENEMKFLCKKPKPPPLVTKALGCHVRSQNPPQLRVKG